MPPDEPPILERELEPKPAHRRDIDINLPLIPRLRDATWSFQTATLFSMKGMTDCTTSSRMNALIAVASEPKRYGVPSVPRSTKASSRKLVYVCLCSSEHLPASPAPDRYSDGESHSHRGTCMLSSSVTTHWLLRSLKRWQCSPKCRFI